MTSACTPVDGDEVARPDDRRVVELGEDLGLGEERRSTRSGWPRPPPARSIFTATGSPVVSVDRSPHGADRSAGDLGLQPVAAVEQPASMTCLPHP